MIDPINEKTGKAIGIDLGTTNSCVVICDAAGETVLPNAKGGRTTPSVVCWKTNTSFEIGEGASKQSMMHPKSVIYEAKRLMGLSFKENSDIIKKHIAHVAYEVINKNDRAILKVVPTQGGEAFEVSPEEVAAKILMRLKEEASAYLGHPVTSAVITVPSYFNDLQRQATKDAAEIAGLKVLRMINEPTAAALAYYRKSDVEKNVAVYDLGGGTFDISILEITPGLAEVKATGGDTFLGGANADSAIADYLKKKIVTACSGIAIHDPWITQKIRQLAEDTKKSLSHTLEVEISENFGYVDGRALNFEMKMTRAQLEELIRPIIDKTRGVCQAVLKDAQNFGIVKIDEVILVGGMTRVPLVQKIVSEIFPNSKVLKDFNPDEIVAQGAAVQAAILTESQADSVGKKMVLSDVTPLSMGIETLGGVFTKMIERNTPVPTKNVQVYTTAENNQSEVHIKIYQGERALVVDNKLLGEFVLKGIKPEPKGMPQIEVTFDIDVNGMVTVSAVDKKTGASQAIDIKSTTSMNAEEKKRLIEEAELHSRKDAAKLEIVKGISAADSAIYDAKSKLEEYSQMDTEIKTEVQSRIEELETSLSSLKLQYSNPNADPEGALQDTLKEVQNKTNELMASVTKASGYAKSGEGSDQATGSEQTASE